jgi:hypothetical protein
MRDGYIGLKIAPTNAVALAESFLLLEKWPKCKPPRECAESLTNGILLVLDSLQNRFDEALL